MSETCFIGDNVFVVDSCTAFIVSDGHARVEKYNYPTTQFTLHVLKVSDTCEPVGGGACILYLDVHGDWVESNRTDSSGGYGYSWVSWTFSSPGTNRWQIVWGNCLRTFVTGNPCIVDTTTRTCIPNNPWYMTDNCGNVYYNNTCAPTGLEGWTIILEECSLHGGVSYTSPTIHMWVYEGCTLDITKTYTVTGDKLSFDYSWAPVYNTAKIQLYIDNTLTIDEFFTWWSGHKEYNISAYKTKSARINFVIQDPENRGWSIYKSSLNISNLLLNCTPNWNCNLPYDGIESDGCGNSRSNVSCNPPSIYQCEQPLNGYESDQYGNRRLNSSCNSPANITATSIVSNVPNNTCTTPCSNTNITVTWTNTGQTLGNFTPAITVGGTTISPYPSQDLASGASVTKMFVIPNLSANQYQICPNPN